MEMLNRSIPTTTTSTDRYSERTGKLSACTRTATKEQEVLEEVAQSPGMN
jgi:hypothetical protein